MDRVGSRGANAKYYPYGEEKTATTNDKYKFATYYRDSHTGLDYARNRYYDSRTGRFLSPDPYQASAGPDGPSSRNRYVYVEGDPANYADPDGLVRCTGDGGYVSCVTAYGKTYSNAVLGGGYSGLDFAKMAEETWGKFLEMRDFEMTTRDRARAAIAGLSANCIKELGAHYNLFDGPNSLLEEVNRATFLDGTQRYIASHGVARYGISSIASVGTMLSTAAAFVSQDSFGHPLNTVIIGHLAGTRAYPSYNAMIVHEMLHVNERLDDVQLANALLIGGRLYTEEESEIASGAVSFFLDNNCERP